METTDSYQASEPTHGRPRRLAALELVFVDHSYHTVTGSSRFFRTILDDAFDVVDLHCDDWRGGRRVTARDVDAVGADIAVFWQALPSPIDLFRLAPHAGLGPDVRRRRPPPAAFWRVLAEANPHIVSFCHALSRIAARYGLPFTEYRYYPDPSDLPQVERRDGRLASLLWDRGDIGIDQLSRLVPPSGGRGDMPEARHGPGTATDAPGPVTRRRIGSARSRGPCPRDEHLRLLAASDVFLAPRRAGGNRAQRPRGHGDGAGRSRPRPAGHERVHRARRDRLPVRPDAPADARPPRRARGGRASASERGRRTHAVGRVQGRDPERRPRRRAHGCPPTRHESPSRRGPGRNGGGEGCPCRPGSRSLITESGSRTPALTSRRRHFMRSRQATPRAAAAMSGSSSLLPVDVEVLRLEQSRRLRRSPAGWLVGEVRASAADGANSSTTARPSPRRRPGASRGRGTGRRARSAAGAHPASGPGEAREGPGGSRSVRCSRFEQRPARRACVLSMPTCSSVETHATQSK